MKRLLPMLLVLLAGCTSPKRTPQMSAKPDQSFAQISEEFLTGHLAWRPQLGVSLGLHDYDGKISDYSRASIEAELKRLKTFEGQLLSLNKSRLSQQELYDYRILLASVQMELFRFEDMETFKINPMTYASLIDVNIYIKRNFAPLEERAKSIIAIERETPRVLAAARANLAASLPKPYVETAIEITKGAADFLGKDLVLALKDLKNDLLMSEFKQANERAIYELRDYARYLEVEKLPNSHLRYALGREKFQKMLRAGELISISPERILEIGLKELQSEQASFAETAKKIDPNKEPIAVFREMQKDHPPAESLIADSKKNLETIRQFIVDHRIVTLPSDVRVQVDETPQYARATSFASMDTPGPFERKATEAYYYITPVEPQWSAEQKEQWLTAFNYYTTDVVSIHEAYPGHYTQFLHLNASPATKIERIFGSYAFVEGWAHYTEQMLIDEGFPASESQSSTPAERSKAAKYRLAQLDEALLRLCRLCVSIKTHCEGMTLDQATQFFQENCYYEAKPSRQEALRGSFDPEYLYYTLGKLQILKLRADYQKQEGGGYSLQKFHDEALRHGMPPIRLLREILLKDRNAWEEIL